MALKVLDLESCSSKSPIDEVELAKDALLRCRA